jgi:hypothetical protein
MPPKGPPSRRGHGSLEPSGFRKPCALARLVEGSADTAAYQIAEVHAYRGEKDRAFEWLERARQQRDPGLGGLRSDPLLANLQKDPRWNPFVRKMGLADDQLK